MVFAFSAFQMSCKKSFLDQTDPTRILVNNYYNDSAKIATAVNAAYASLRPIYNKIFPFAEVSSDNSYSISDGSGNGDFEYFTITSANSTLEAEWTYLYQSIALCNVVLENLDSIDMNASVKSRWKSEVKFIRALDYFNLVRIWGDVPLVTTQILSISDAYQYGRIPVSTVYAQIEKDLSDADADANLPVKYTSTNDLGRVTKPAVKGLLAKVYLTENKYNDAASKLFDYISSYDGSASSLQTTYSNIFLVTNEMNAEIVFAVRYASSNTPSTGSYFTSQFPQYNMRRQDLIDTLKANGAADKRIAVTNKYSDVSGYLDANCDWIVLRYADILLMYAEALNEQSVANTAIAVPYVNRVRNRAGLTNLPTSLTQSQLRYYIEHERRVELNFEGHRWFDLVRTGRAIAVMNNHFSNYNIVFNKSGAIIQIDDHDLLFPIPLQEINTVGSMVLPQNPGY